MTQSIEIEHVPRSTFFWVLGTLVSIQTAVMLAVLTILTDNIKQVDQRITQTEAELIERIRQNELEVDSMQSDIRAILVGIEQVKGRLGIIESSE